MLERVLAIVPKHLHGINRSTLLELSGFEVLPDSPNPYGPHQEGEFLHKIPNGDEEPDWSVRENEEHDRND